MKWIFQPPNSAIAGTFLRGCTTVKESVSVNTCSQFQKKLIKGVTSFTRIDFDSFHLPVSLRNGAVNLHDLLLRTWANATESAVEIDPCATAGAAGSSAIVPNK